MADDPLRDTKERVLLEGQKAYIVVNAVGAVVLLAFLQAIWSTAGGVSLKKGVLCGIVAFAAGIAVALLGYAARHWALRKNQVNSGWVFQIAAIWIPLIVVACFLAGMIFPVVGGFDALNTQPGTQQKGTPDTGKKK
jgi:uncharacterized membrane protein